MSATSLAGGLRVAARWADGGLHDWQVQLVRPPVARALAGLTPAAALARLPLYFSLCGQAQHEAGRLALAAAGCDPGGEAPPAWWLWAECLHEHLWRLLVDYPKTVDAQPELAAFAAWRTVRGQGRAALVEATAKLADAVIHGAGLARVRQALDAEGAGDGLAARIAAFDAAAAALADGLDFPHGSSGNPARGRGDGWVHTARGTLRHAVLVVDGVVAAWQVDAPTDRKFLDEAGIVERLPARLPGVDAARRAVERAVLALDPCVPYSVEIVNA